jgi:choline dehydrogenase
MHMLSRNPLHFASPSPFAAANVACSPAMVNGKIEVARKPAPQPFRIAETMPGLGIKSDYEILDAISTLSQTAYHVAGTCRTGADSHSIQAQEGR